MKGLIHLRLANKIESKTRDPQSLQTKAASKNRTRVNLRYNPKLKHDPKIHGFKRFKATLNHEGDQNSQKLGKTVTAVTIGDYLVNLDL